MTDYVKAMFGTAVKSLWDLLPWRRTDHREVGTTQTRTNGLQHHNNNGIYSLSRKRKSEHPDCFNLYAGSDTAPCPKYQRLIQEMSQQKQRRYGASTSNGILKREDTPLKASTHNARFTSNEKSNMGSCRGTNTGNSGYGLKASLAATEQSRGPSMSAYSLINQGRQTHKNWAGYTSKWEDLDENPTPLNIGVSGKSAWQTLKKPTDTSGTTFLSTTSKRNVTSNHLGASCQRRQPRLYSTPLRQDVLQGERLTSFKPTIKHCSTLYEYNELPIVDAQPKIFSSSVDRARPFSEFTHSLFPSNLSPINSSVTSSSQLITPISAKPPEKEVEDDDDLVIVGEKIISTKHNPFRTNSLELETRSSKYSKKSWLDESLGIFHDNRKFREDRIDYETKKLAVLKNKSTLISDIEARIRNNLTLTDIIVLEEPEEARLPEITPQMKEIIENAVRGRESDVIVVTSNNIQITKGDLRTLAPGQWLNDNIINSYMDLISARAKSDTSFPKIHVFSTFFYPKYLKEGYSNILKRWTRKVDIFAVDQIIFPIHLGVHWCLAVADHRVKTLKFYDSLFGNHRRALEALLTYLANEHKERKKSELDTLQWKLILESGIPGQENGSDCGVFTCQFAEYLSRDAKITFSQKQMPYFRQRMIYETVKQEIKFR